MTSLSRELLAMNLIREGSRINQGRGQPTIPLELNPYAAFSFGIAFHIYRIEIALTNFCGEIVDILEFRYQEKDVVEHVIDLSADFSANRQTQAATGQNFRYWRFHA